MPTVTASLTRVSCFLIRPFCFLLMFMARGCTPGTLSPPVDMWRDSNDTQPWERDCPCNLHKAHQRACSKRESQGGDKVRPKLCDSLHKQAG